MDPVECYACEREIKGGEWVVPLKTYEAAYRGEEFVLNSSKTLETIIHASCLKKPVDDASEIDDFTAGDGGEISEPRECPTCSGTGSIENDAYSITEACPNCRGLGIV